MTACDPKATLANRNTKTVDAIDADGIPHQAELEWWPGSTSVHVTIRVQNRTYKARSSDYFDAFCKARSPLEKKGFRFLCQGASLDVWPSGMCRDMGAGMKAYKLVIGNQVNPLQDMVDIFSCEGEVVPATVAEQKAQFEKWWAWKMNS